MRKVTGLQKTAGLPKVTIVMVARGSPVFYLKNLVNQARFYSRYHTGAWRQTLGSIPMKNPVLRLEITEKTWLCLLLICIINMLVLGLA